MNNIVRKIRLSKLGCYHIKDNESELFSFVENNILGLKAVSLERYPNFIMYFNNKGNNVFQYSIEKNNVFFNTSMRNNLKDKFGYNYKQIKKLIECIVKQVFKLTKINVWITGGFMNYWVEMEYKNLNIN